MCLVLSGGTVASCHTPQDHNILVRKTQGKHENHGFRISNFFFQTPFRKSVFAAFWKILYVYMF